MALWTPANLATAPRLWLDGDDAAFNGSNQLTGITLKGSDGGAAASVNGPPTKATLNSLNGILFDASGETVQKAVSAWGSSGWMSVVLVWVPSTGALAADTGAFHSGHGINPTGTVTFHPTGSAAGEGLWFAANGYSGAPMLLSGSETWAEGAGHIAVGVAGSSVGLWMDGTSVTLDTANTGSVPNLSARNWIIGENFGNETLRGGMFQLILLDYNPTTAERQQIEGWAAHKYGLTSSLPVDHPYKTNAPQQTITGTGAATLVLTAAGTANHGVAGTASATLALTASSSGTFTAPEVTGTGAATLGLTASGAGATGAAGQGSATLALAASASGSHGVAGTGSATLGLTASASGAVAIDTITGTGSATLVLIGEGAGAWLGWTAVSATPETWTAQSPTAETWTKADATPETWT